MLKALIEQDLREIIAEMELEADFSVEYPKHVKFGDYSSNIAMLLAKDLKRNPMEIAAEIAAKLNGKEYLESVDVVAPGFINFTVNPNFVEEKYFQPLLDSGLDSLIPAQERAEKVIVEHTSVNPNKSLHIGHLRNAILGDSIGRLLKRAGYQVEIQNYIDDTGVQVADTVTALRKLGFEQPEGQSFDDYCWDIYTEFNKRIADDQSLIAERQHVTELIEQGGNETAEYAAKIVDQILDHHLQTLDRFGISYDLLVYESDVIRFGFWEAAFEKLQGVDSFVLETSGPNKGCWVMRYDGSEGDKIFVRANGTKVYTAKDTAYHMWKFNQISSDFKYSKWSKNYPNNQKVYRTDPAGSESDQFGKGERVINLIDERQSYPQQIVKLALKSFGFEKEASNLIHVPYGVVVLSPQAAQMIGLDTSDEKGAYAMSGRKGIGVKVNDLYRQVVAEISKVQEDSKKKSANVQSDNTESIAVAALRHYMLKFNSRSEISFDFKEALTVEGNTGPYLQYSYARANGILVKAGDEKYEFSERSELSSTERALQMMLIRWPEVLERATAELDLSLIADYGFSLASAFHSFYQANPVLKNATDQEKSYRLALIKVYTDIFADLLNIMGIPLLKQM